MKKWEFTIAVVIRGKKREDAEKKLDLILNHDYLYNDDELSDIADLLLDGGNWDCEEYDD